MKIELKNVKYAKFASEETDCFEATVYIDGKKAGTVSNDGHGGPDNFYPFELEQRLNAHAATLPKRKWRDVGIDSDGEYPNNAESVIGDLFGDWLLRKDFAKALKKFCFTIKGEPRDGVGLYTTKVRPKVVPAEIDQILNDLPVDEAFAIFKARTSPSRSN